MFTNETTNDQMDAIFQALAHEHRRRILDHLKASPGMPVGELARLFDVSRIAVMHHLAILERTGLVLSQKESRIRRLYLNSVPIQQIHERWSDAYGAEWAGHLTNIKAVAEAKARKRKEKA